LVWLDDRAGRLDALDHTLGQSRDMTIGGVEGDGDDGLFSSPKEGSACNLQVDKGITSCAKAVALELVRVRCKVSGVYENTETARGKTFVIEYK